MDRRTFLTWVGVGGIASSLPVAIAACSDKTTTNETALNSTTPASAARSDGFQAVGALDSKGELDVPKFASGPLLVIRNPASPESLVAVNPTCTHKACPVTWQAEQQVFFCACHDSKFAADGKALQGPATEPLKTYEAKLEGNTVLVKT